MKRLRDEINNSGSIFKYVDFLKECYLKKQDWVLFAIFFNYILFLIFKLYIYKNIYILVCTIYNIVIEKEVIKMSNSDKIECHSSHHVVGRNHLPAENNNGGLKTPHYYSLNSILSNNIYKSFEKN